MTLSSDNLIFVQNSIKYIEEYNLPVPNALFLDTIDSIATIYPDILKKIYAEHKELTNEIHAKISENNSVEKKVNLDSSNDDNDLLIYSLINSTKKRYQFIQSKLPAELRKLPEIQSYTTCTSTHSVIDYDYQDSSDEEISNSTQEIHSTYDSSAFKLSTNKGSIDFEDLLKEFEEETDQNMLDASKNNATPTPQITNTDKILTWPYRNTKS